MPDPVALDMLMVQLLWFDADELPVEPGGWLTDDPLLCRTEPAVILRGDGTTVETAADLDRRDAVVIPLALARTDGNPDERRARELTLIDAARRAGFALDDAAC